MLDLNVYDVVVKSKKDGSMFIKVGDYKIPYDVYADADYMKQAVNFVSGNLGYTVIGVDYKSIVASRSLVKVIELFSFEELSDTARAKAIADYRNGQFFFDGDLLDSLVNLCEDLGFHNADIEYRLHDGGSFVTISGGFKRPDIESLRPNYLNLEILKIIGTIAALPSDYECDDISRIEDYADETTDDTVCFYHHVLENTIEMLSEYCLKDLKENFEYQQTDEYIIDDIDCNGYVFNKNGIMESKI